MKNREHSCLLNVDYAKRIIICTPRDSGGSAILTTACLYAWHQYQLTTEEGIQQWLFVELVGWVHDEPVLKIKEGFRICFVGCKQVFLYGIILGSEMNQSLYSFVNCASNIIMGSPFLKRKNLFLSHSSKDKSIVRELASALDPHFNVFFDEKSINLGDSITAKINDGLVSSDVLMLCMSASVSGSDWVAREYAYALHEKIEIVPHECPVSRLTETQKLFI